MPTITKVYKKTEEAEIEGAYFNFKEILTHKITAVVSIR